MSHREVRRRDDGPDYLVRPVGVFRSPYSVHVGTPRQPRAETGSRDRPGRIEIHQGLQNLLRDLEGFSHLWVISWFHFAYGWNDLVKPPRDGHKRGLFATRAPHRPNPIGISVVELLSIDKRIVHVGAHDLLDGTPVLDLKPYVAYADAVPDARCGWVDALGDRAGPDHRDWQDGESGGS